MIRNVCVIVVSLWMLTVVFAGCAKRSPVGQASAPAASGLAAAAASRAAPTAREAAMAPAPTRRFVTVVAAEIPRMATAAPISIPRPAPKGFERTPELTPIHFDFDKFDIRPSDAPILNAHARWLYANPKQLVLIEDRCVERHETCWSQNRRAELLSKPDE